MVPESGRCERCGTSVRAALAFCPRCGARMGEQSRGITLAKVLSALGLAIVAVCFGAVGACFFLSNGSDVPDPVGFIYAAVSWLGAATVLFGMVKALR